MSSWQSSWFKSEAMEHHAKKHRWMQPEKNVHKFNDQKIWMKIMYKIEINFSQNCEELIPHKQKKYLSTETKPTKLNTDFKKKSDGWADYIHHNSNLRNITWAQKRWDKQGKIEIKIQESDDSYGDHYEIYWRFAQKRKNSMSTDSIPTKKQHVLHSIDFQQKIT